MRKVFRKIAEGTCDKKFIGDNAETPEGWHDNTADALRLGETEEPVAPEPTVEEEPTEETE